MSQSRDGIPWLRISAEGAAIVISILFAFAIDAWWEGLQDRRREIVVLQGLRADFRQSSQDLVPVRERLERTNAAAGELLRLMGTDAARVESPAVDTLMADLLLGATFQPTDATLTSLQGSEGLGAISSRPLRVALSSWSHQIVDLAEREEWLVEHMRQGLLPFLYPRLPVRSLDAIAQPDIGGESSRFRFDSAALLTSVHFENLVNERLLTSHNVLVEMDELEVVQHQVLELLEEQLDESESR